MSRSVLPRDMLPNDSGAGPNDPAVSVGPTSSEGFGNEHVMFNTSLPAPPGVAAWSGWPVGWDTPNWTAPGWLVQRTATVGTCADTIGRTMSTFPPRVLRGDLSIDPQPLWCTNPEPLLYASFDEWVRGVANSLLIAGEAFLYCTGRNAQGYPSRFVSLNPYHVTLEWEGGAVIPRLNDTLLDPPDVLHVKYQTVPGSLRGSSPLSWIARNMFTASALEQFASDLANRGGVPWAVVTHPGTLREGQASDLLGQWRTAQQNRIAGDPAILSGGMTLSPLSFSPESMALLSLREFDEQRIAAGMGVPALFVGLAQPGHMNYTSTEMLADFFYRNTLRPLARNLANALSGWLLPRGTNMVFDASEYLEPTLAMLITAYVAAAGVGAVTNAEIRQVLGLPSQIDAPAPDPTGVTV
jgi:HK97 family phage portal protein